MSLTITPITQREAFAFVSEHHRHHQPPRGSIVQVAVACSEKEEVVGVAIVGRPVSRMLDDGWTAEVTRVATDGSRNACSAETRKPTTPERRRSRGSGDSCPSRSRRFESAGGTPAAVRIVQCRSCPLCCEFTWSIRAAVSSDWSPGSCSPESATATVSTRSSLATPEMTSSHSDPTGKLFWPTWRIWSAPMEITGWYSNVTWSACVFGCAFDPGNA